VTFQARTLLKAVLKQLREKGLILRKRYDAVPDVARREHVEFFAQASTRTAVVTDRDYCTKVTDGRFGKVDIHGSRGRNVSLEPF